MESLGGLLVVAAEVMLVFLVYQSSLCGCDNIRICINICLSSDRDDLYLSE